MSKSSQRKKSFFQQGFNDFKKDYFRWYKHPFLSSYRSGWNFAKRLKIDLTASQLHD